MATSTITIISGASTVTLDNTISTITLGTSGPQGAPGEGVPVGGTAGQILQKDSATDYDTSWIDNYTTDVRKYVKNDSGGTLTKGTVVYVSGANGANVLVKPALATTDGTSATTIGFLNETLANNGQGYAIVEGTISGIDTSTATAGDPVWLSGAVAGGVLYGVANKPQAPVHIVYLGTVTRAHATQGQIEISVNNGWELDELHNVAINSVADGQVLAYNAATSLWVNSTPNPGDITGVTAGTGITGGGTSGTVTVSLDNTKVSYDAASSLRSLPLYNQKDAAERLLAQAVWWIDAAHSSASGQTITNLGWGGSALNATAGSTGSADSNDPKFLDWTGTNYAYLTGATGNYLSVPDATALDITGDIDIRMQLALDDWTPASACSALGKWTATGNQRTFRIDITPTGGLQFIWSTDGTTSTSASSTAAVSFADGAIGWIRATLDVDNGAAGNTVTFYTSTDGSSWTQLGNTVVTAGVTSIYSSTANLEIGSLNVGTTQPMTAKVYSTQILNGIGGTTVLNVDTSVITSGAATSFTALTGQTVTINRATSGRKTCVVTNPLWLFGTDDYINTPDNDLLDFAATESYCVFASGRVFATPTAYGAWVSKYSTAGGAGFNLFQNVSAYSAGIDVRDTTTNAAGYSPATASGTLTILGANVDRGTNQATVYANGTAGTAASIATVTGTSANALPLRVGSTSNGGNYFAGEIYGAALFRRTLTAAEQQLLSNYYAGRVA